MVYGLLTPLLRTINSLHWYFSIYTKYDFSTNLFPTTFFLFQPNYVIYDLIRKNEILTFTMSVEKEPSFVLVKVFFWRW